jgi:hypothetical protein
MANQRKSAPRSKNKMPPIQYLSGVAEALGNHATSHLSEMIEHLSLACGKAKIYEVTLDLLNKYPLPSRFLTSPELNSSTHALQQKFQEMLAAASFTLADVKTAKVVFRFSPETPRNRLKTKVSKQRPLAHLHDPAFQCESLLVSKTGKEFRHNFASHHFSENYRGS